MARDYYSILGISRGAADKEVRQAYRRLARQHHPDVNRGDKDAGTRFKEINEAYQVLSNVDSRKKYDKFGNDWRHADQFQPAAGENTFSWLFQSAGPGGRRRRARTPFNEGDGLGSLFGDFVNGGQGARISGDKLSGPREQQVAVTISLEEAYRGAPRNIQASTDPLSGTPGRRLEIKVPPGVDTGSRVHVGPRDQGHQREADLYLVVTVAPHSQFQRQGNDLQTTVTVPVVDAVLGGEVAVPTIKGTRVSLKLPPETQNGRTFRLQGQGMPRLKRPDQHGNLLVTIHVRLPDNLNDEERTAYERLRELRPR